jgi:hypothetical protein
MTDNEAMETVDLKSKESPSAEGETTGSTNASDKNVDTSGRVNGGDVSPAAGDPKGDAPSSSLTARTDEAQAEEAIPLLNGSSPTGTADGETLASSVGSKETGDAAKAPSLDEEAELLNEKKRPYKGSTDPGDCDEVDSDNDSSSVDKSKRAKTDELKPLEKTNNIRWNEMYDRLVAYKVMVARACKTITA